MAHLAIVHCSVKYEVFPVCDDVIQYYYYVTQILNNIVALCSHIPSFGQL